jgi:hypothetical protein
MFGTRAVRDQVVGWVDRAIGVQDGVVRAHVAQVRAADPEAPAQQVVAALESQYLATVSAAGAAVGGAASVPAVGTGIAVGLSVAETVAFLDATALFVVATAEALGRPVGDLARRRALLLVALLGDDAVALVPSSPDGAGWATRLTALDDATVAGLNRTAEKWLVTRYGPRQSVLVLGRLVPFGIGAAVGAAGNALTAKGIISRIRAGFGDVVPAAEPQPEPEVQPEPVVTTPVVELRTAAPVPAFDPPTGKYLGLYTVLVERADPEPVLALDEVSAAVPGGLPAAARRDPAWWSNEPGARAGHVRAWLAAGLEVAEADLASGKIRWRRATR